MFSLTLALHSWLRWIVVLAGLAAVVRAVTGRSAGKPWTPADDRLGLIFSVGLDLQVLIGILLYVLSPITTSAFVDMAATMQNRVTRFWTVEHVTMMLVALVVAHIGRARIRRATDAAARHRAAAILFGIALALVLLGIPWPFLPYGRALVPLG